MSELHRLVEIVESADSFKHRQLATEWPELAEALAGVIEGMTEHDAPRCWWSEVTEPGERVTYPALPAGSLVAYWVTS